MIGYEHARLTNTLLMQHYHAVSGSMHKRGYREVVHRAALRESTAAALLLAAGWGVGGVGGPGERVEVRQRVNRRPITKKVGRGEDSEVEAGDETLPRQPVVEVGQGVSPLQKSTPTITSASIDSSNRMISNSNSNSDPDNGIVMMDPFCGSGTLLIEAALIYAGDDFLIPLSKLMPFLLLTNIGMSSLQTALQG